MGRTLRASPLHFANCPLDPNARPSASVRQPVRSFLHQRNFPRTAKYVRCASRPSTAAIDCTARHGCCSGRPRPIEISQNHKMPNLPEPGIKIRVHYVSKIGIERLRVLARARAPGADAGTRNPSIPFRDIR